MATSVGADRFYSRYGNPTVNDFEQAVADLEGAEAARAFSSGMGAVSGVVLGLCSSGDHIVAQRQLYAGTQLLLQTACPRFGIDVTFVDGTEPGAFAAAVRPGKTVLVWAETPANPKLDLVDLDELGAIAGPMTVVDSTFATPLGAAAARPRRRPGGPLGHQGDRRPQRRDPRCGGRQRGAARLAVVLRGPAGRQRVARSTRSTACGASARSRCGSAASPRARWRLAERLEAHPKVESVRYPGLASHPQFDLAKRQMALPGGLLCFDVAGGLEAGRTFVESVELAEMASSLGGPETLVTHPASTTHVNLTPEELEANGIGPGSIRVSVGLEHPDDIIADFEHALSRIA